MSFEWVFSEAAGLRELDLQVRAVASRAGRMGSSCARPGCGAIITVVLESCFAPCEMFAATPYSAAVDEYAL